MCIRDRNEIVFADNSDPVNYYKTGVMYDPQLPDRLYDAGITDFGTPVVEQMPWLLSFLISWVLPFALIFLVGQLLTRSMMKRNGMAGGPTMSFGKSNAKVYVQSTGGVKFSDVAGEDEAKELLSEIVDFLHDPEKYAKIGATIPKGALLVGPPGTGKKMCIRDRV